jgi:hypothetical protein
MARGENMKLLLAIAMLLSLTACDDAQFSTLISKNKSQGEGGLEEPPGGEDPDPESVPDFVFLDESFERQEIIDADTTGRWIGAMEDGSKMVDGFLSDGAGAKIFGDDQMGPALDGRRALYFFGAGDRRNQKVIYLTSKSYDLSKYNTVNLSFSYLTAALNEATSGGVNSPWKGIRIQVCRGTADECRRGGRIDGGTIFSSSLWVTLAESRLGERDDHLDGTNHRVRDFLTEELLVDLNNKSVVGDKSAFTFRFVVVVRDGLRRDSDRACDPREHSNDLLPALVQIGIPEVCSTICQLEDGSVDGECVNRCGQNPPKCPPKPPVCASGVDIVILDKVVGKASVKTDFQYQ